tara:strand:- start:559 stop:708 length:150 start_codon:yes stop_codon:yes gene_type:complete
MLLLIKEGPKAIPFNPIYLFLFFHIIRNSPRGIAINTDMSSKSSRLIYD